MAANSKKNKVKAVEKQSVKADKPNQNFSAKKTKEKAPKRSGNSGKNKKTGIFKRFVDYIKGTFIELKKVNWLSSDELLKSTLVVFGIVAILTLIVWIIDTGLGALTTVLLKL